VENSGERAFSRRLPETWCGRLPSCVLHWGCCDASTMSWRRALPISKEPVADLEEHLGRNPGISAPPMSESSHCAAKAVPDWIGIGQA
jgi:hypothetical protein